jgi:hypothetical protein
MKYCDFTYAPLPDGRYQAACRVCGREVKTRTTKAVASCRTNPVRHAPEVVAQAAGVAMAKPPVTAGPGTELKAILKDWLGIEATAGCGCNQTAARMDALGPDWCESDAGMTEILRTMRNEHAKRWRDGRTKLPWTDLGARQLVKLACRRARKSSVDKA